MISDYQKKLSKRDKEDKQIMTLKMQESKGEQE